jgi:hypothetical protein
VSAAWWCSRLRSSRTARGCLRWSGNASATCKCPHVHAEVFAGAAARTVLAHAVEPTLQRELKHKGAANGDGSYSAELIGYVEINRVLAL